MSGGGKGDRRGAGALRPGGGRPVRASQREALSTSTGEASSKVSKLRAANASLIGLDGKRVATVTMVIDDDAPLIVMFEGEPYLIDTRVAEHVYFQVRPYRADAMVIDEVSR